MRKLHSSKIVCDVIPLSYHCILSVGSLIACHKASSFSPRLIAPLE